MLLILPGGAHGVFVPRFAPPHANTWMEQFELSVIRCASEPRGVVRLLIPPLEHL